MTKSSKTNSNFLKIKEKLDSMQQEGFTPSAKDIEFGLTHEDPLVRAAFAGHNNHSLTHDQFDRCLRDRSVDVREAAIKRRDRTLSAPQVKAFFARVFPFCSPFDFSVPGKDAVALLERHDWKISRKEVDRILSPRLVHKLRGSLHVDVINALLLRCDVYMPDQNTIPLTNYLNKLILEIDKTPTLKGFVFQYRQMKRKSYKHILDQIDQRLFSDPVRHDLVTEILMHSENTHHNPHQEKIAGVGGCLWHNEESLP